MRHEGHPEALFAVAARVVRDADRAVGVAARVVRDAARVVLAAGDAVLVAEAVARVVRDVDRAAGVAARVARDVLPPPVADRVARVVPPVAAEVDRVVRAVPPVARDALPGVRAVLRVVARAVVRAARVREVPAVPVFPEPSATSGAITEPGTGDAAFEEREAARSRRARWAITVPTPMAAATGHSISPATASAPSPP
ncbi:hypothetical protein ACFYSC_09200 [Streptosporangium sp. NPDC004379]|uniref:hypothetical protein n=1 Tax=Streptosporangium sp. NPDC004379 TaxID=3366189 RepID=UPI003673FA1F